jgi:predicted TIM-barrel fold metal-dependent hydrolase
MRDILGIERGVLVSGGAYGRNSRHLLDLLDAAGPFRRRSAELGAKQPAFQTVLRMLESGRVWVKLSGPMDCSKLEFPHADIVPFARTIARHAPGRLV